MRAGKRIRPTTRIWPVLGCYTMAAVFLAIPILDALGIDMRQESPLVAYPAWAVSGISAGVLGLVYQRRWQFCQRPGLNDLAIQFADAVQRLNPGRAPHTWVRLRNVDESVLFVCSLTFRAGKRWELARLADEDTIAIQEGLEEGRTVTGYWETFVVHHAHPVMHFQQVDSVRPGSDGKILSAGDRVSRRQWLKTARMRLFSGSVLATEADLTTVLRQLAGAHDVDEHWD